MIFLEVTNPTFSYFAPLLMIIICALAAVLVAVLPVLTHALFSFIKAKTGIVINESQQKMFTELVDSVVMQVEQLARKELKLGNEAPDGAKKLEQAVEKVEERLKETGLYDQFKDRIADEIEAGVARLNGPLKSEEKDELAKANKE